MGLRLLVIGAILASTGVSATAALVLSEEELVEAGGIAIDVPGYSVPLFADWDSDGLPDLVVGEGSGSLTPRVRVYLNSGTPSEPAFTAFTYAQSDTGDLTVPGGG